MKTLDVRMAGKVAEIYIYGDIVDDIDGKLGLGISAPMMAAALKELKGVSQITQRFNSEGGDVFHAETMYRLLRNHPAKIVSEIDALAASAASLLAMAGDEIYIAENAMMMVHDPSVRTRGTAGDLRKTAGILDQVEAGIRSIYAERTGQSDDEIDALMAAETWMNATEALDLGFADKLSAPLRIAAHVDPHRFRRTPKHLIRPENDASVLRAKIEKMGSKVKK